MAIKLRKSGITEKTASKNIHSSPRKKLHNFFTIFKPGDKNFFLDRINGFHLFFMKISFTPLDLAPRLLGVERQTQYVHTTPFHVDSENLDEKIIRLAADGEK